MTEREIPAHARESNECDGAPQTSTGHYTLKPVTTPVQKPASLGGAQANDAPACRRSPNDPFVRAAHEDDDGYDPFSDRPEEQPLFEKNPWD